MRLEEEEEEEPADVRGLLRLLGRVETSICDLVDFVENEGGMVGDVEGVDEAGEEVP